jgi:hypothetical protein
MTINNVQRTLTMLEAVQITSNSILDKLCDILAKLYLNLETDEMGVSQPEKKKKLETPSEQSVSSKGKISTAVRTVAFRNARNQGLDPATKTLPMAPNN